MNKDKFLYFRTQATDINDDSHDDSACYPVSSLMGMAPASDSTLELAFLPRLRRPGNFGIDHDLITLNLTTNNTHLTAMTAIVRAINNNTSTIIVVANDDSDGTEYLANSGIASIDTIVVRGV
tara:strand:+ start:180 stop:548 length:369 start_codon:yes stop_codon:yes gene_type:complete